MLLPNTSGVKEYLLDSQVSRWYWGMNNSGKDINVEKDTQPSNVIMNTNVVNVEQTDVLSQYHHLFENQDSWKSLGKDPLTLRIFQEVDHFSKTKIQPTHKIELAKVEFQAMLNHYITKLNIVKTEVYVKTEVQETLPETENPPIKSVDN